MSRASLLAVAVLMACSSQPLPAGNLADPSKLAVATSTGLKSGIVVLIGEGDGEDLRAFVPTNSCNSNKDCDEGISCDTVAHICPAHFIRGPNAISALSIALTSSLNGQTLPAFRAQGIAAGTVPTTAGVPAKGYAVIAGDATRVAVIDTQTFRTTVSAADAMACAAGTPSLSCLPSPALDVATTPTKAFVLLATDTAGKLCVAGHQCVLVLKASEENGSVVLSRDSQAPIDLGTGDFVRMRIGAGAGGATTIFVADASEPVAPAPTNPQGVASVPVEGGAVTKFPTSGSARLAVPTPDGAFVLAVLGDGRVESLDTTTAMPPTDSLNRPLAPIGFVTPAVDLVFLPCNAGQMTPCQKSIFTGSTTTTSANIAVLGMGDGSAIPIFPDATVRGLFRPINLANDPVPSPPGIASSDPTVASTFSLMVSGQTLGITRTESVVVVNRGSLPSFVSRSGQLNTSTATLKDVGGFSASLPDQPQVGDVVRLHPIGSDCASLENTEVAIATVTAPDTFTLMLPTGFPCTSTNLGVAYDVLAANETVGPWVVTGTFSGFMGRMPTPADTMTPSTLSFAGERFYYPGNYVASATEPALALSLARTSPGDVVEGANFLFSTSSGFKPFSITSSASTNGLTISVAAVNDSLYMAILGSNSLTEVNLPSYTRSGSVTDYR